MLKRRFSTTEQYNIRKAPYINSFVRYRLYTKTRRDAAEALRIFDFF